jgi:glyoxylate reductase
MPELSRIERPSIRVTRTLLPAVERRMAELFDASFNPDDAPLTREALIAAMADCDVLVPTVTDSIDAVVMRSYLEHEPRAREVLAGVHAVLRTGGIAVVKVPNYASWNRRIMREGWCGFRF